MIKMRMSSGASALLRALIGRAGVERNRILLASAYSTEWQSLTFEGERHQIALCVTGADAAEVVARMCEGLEDAEFIMPGAIVADVCLAGEPRRKADGSIELIIEGLTVADD